MKIPKVVILLFAVIFLIGEAVEGKEGTVALVNKRAITKAELAGKMKPVVERMGLKPGSKNYSKYMPLIRKKALEILVQRAVALTSRKARDTEVSAEELDKRVAEILKERDIGDLESFKSSLVGEGKSFESWRKDLRDSMVISAIKDGLAGNCKPCTEAEASSLYRKEKKRFTSGGRIKVSMIHLEPGCAQVPNLKQFSTAVRDRVTDTAEEEWGNAAREYSSGPKAGTGGHWDWTYPAKLPKGLGREVMELEVGDVVRVTRGDSFYILRLDEIEEEKQLSFKEAREAVEDEVMRRKAALAWKSWLKAEKRKAKIRF